MLNLQPFASLRVVFEHSSLAFNQNPFPDLGRVKKLLFNNLIFYFYENYFSSNTEGLCGYNEFFIYPG
jgi:hypothetical protein